MTCALQDDFALLLSNSKSYVIVFKSYNCPSAKEMFPTAAVEAESSNWSILVASNTERTLCTLLDV